MECVFPVIDVSILSHVEFGPNDHREDAPHFTRLFIFSNVPVFNLGRDDDVDDVLFILLRYVFFSNKLFFL